MVLADKAGEQTFNDLAPDADEAPAASVTEETKI
jgi:hypothetical protein